MTSTAAPRPTAATREFAMRFTSTPRGARLARRLVSHRLNDWGHLYTSDTNETLTLIAAELTANAVHHGHVPGRDLHLRLTELTEPTPETYRIEVTDTRAERRPHTTPGTPDTESGRGLLLVAALADDWGCAPRLDGDPGKTVWATASCHAQPSPPPPDITQK
ncbi:ATP-binding protein [Streptomyces endophyticus]|uniref:ATP-binding protein n=1 Tax=Streptomyces endophyticus TaxID=714166 RepID=A0ABU6F5Z5_9ACTN|nr:ATP-binding protein [Streptomyces endophyticus]MEB8339431.1 ATP-binding protein [Streptomyces endophyticus]